MIRYTVVIKPMDQLKELIDDVNKAIELGYYPKGGITLIDDKIIQTIYLRDENN